MLWDVLTERYREEVLQELPEIDGVYGVHEQDKILGDITGRLQKELTGERLLTTPSHYAYLKIAEGCNRTCSFCAIPRIRGRNISRPIEALKNEAKQLAAQGVKELILIAQDLTYYGIDNYGKRMLAPLLLELEKVAGIRWIRLHYTFPAQFPEEVLKVMQDSDKVCNYLDIPYSISTAKSFSLCAGNRRNKNARLIQKIRREVPGVGLRTTLIAGYPGETETQFEELAAFVEEMRFERLGVFAYSHEEIPWLFPWRMMWRRR
ncbi:MAG: radical SAM protein [Bacteroidales bacterium]|nr:radical SAM protein [Bacteroidales bacterium]